jgi:hypothetical protein
MYQDYRRRQVTKAKILYFLAYTRKLSVVASGATPIGSADRAPDKKIISREKIQEEGKGEDIF